MEMQGANTHPIPKDQQLAVIPGTSRSSKTSPETSTKITRISCYLGSPMNMALHTCTKRHRTQTTVYLTPRQGEELASL